MKPWSEVRARAQLNEQAVSAHKARMRAVLDRLGEQDTDPGAWDEIAAENAALAPARSEANRALLGDDR